MSDASERGENAVRGPIRLERDGGLAVVTFLSPPLNLFDEIMSREPPWKAPSGLPSEPALGGPPSSS